jgi:hypothetical protein
MSEDPFAEEVKFPDDLESMLTMSVQYEKLQNIMRFVLDLLRRHEQGLRMAFTKQNVIAPEVLTFHTYKETLEVRLQTFEKNQTKANIKIEELKHNLESRGDTVETLKYILNMITDHDSLILQYKKQLQELQQEKVISETRFRSLENTVKSLQVTFEETQKVAAIGSKKNEGEVGESEEIGQSKTFHSPEFPKQGEQSIGFKSQGRKYKSKKGKPRIELIEKHEEKNSENQPVSGNIVPDSRTSNESGAVEVKLTGQYGLGPFQLTSPIPAEMQDMLARIETIEKSLESPPGSSELKNRLGKLESMYKFIEGVLDSCEPLTIRNKNELLKVVRT